jgi:glycosyltransferase 2 family protein
MTVQPAESHARISLRTALTTLLAVAGVGLAGFLLFRTFRTYSLEQILDAATSIPAARIAAAGAFAAASYFCLTLFDTLAVRHVGRELPYPKIALASFCSLSIGHNIGFAALSSGAIRYRFYSGYGLSLGEVAKIILFCAITVGLGLATLGSAALLLRPGLAERVIGIDRSSVLWIGAAAALVPLVYVVVAATVRGSLRVFRWSLEMPSLRIALAQIGIGAANFACVAACLHQVLTATSGVAYPEVAAAYVIANVATLLSHAPGGLGVIESVVSHLLPHAKVIGGLVAFRLVYFVVPLLIGGPLFALSELRRRR